MHSSQHHTPGRLFFHPDNSRAVKEQAFMDSESRRSHRILDYLPLEVRVVGKQDSRILAGPFSGRIIDLSAHGACLLMSQVMHNNFHVFHSTREVDDCVLQLMIDHPPDLNQCMLLAQPVWMGLVRQEEIRAFKMGVEFIGDPEDPQMLELREAIRQNQGQRGSWWQKFGRFIGGAP